ncbi:hypothetical protein BT96DRAFT_674615 [Gymnopus androsaceus JB14]|uniref:Uncharacterized protein n=1 Tax=Gymnopus androsaceus JB14 TaxID=1447944 RepID=A0A6A4GG01_9AGAR|nr:hypothetical protein BT96DRAFT_674615 [Gymnopus androsaceus JB14]
MDHYKEARNKFRLVRPHPSSPTRRRIPLPTPSATQHTLIPLLPSLYINHSSQNTNPDQPTARQLGQQRRREREHQEKLQKHKEESIKADSTSRQLAQQQRCEQDCQKRRLTSKHQ